MTERGVAIIFCKILAPPMPPPSLDATIHNYLNDKDRARHHLLWNSSDPQCPTPSPDVTILNYLNDREGAPLSW